MPARLVSTASAMRRRLIKKADNEYVVTWDDIHSETKKELKKRKLLKSGTRVPSEDWLARQVRDETVCLKMLDFVVCRTDLHHRSPIPASEATPTPRSPSLTYIDVRKYVYVYMQIYYLNTASYESTERLPDNY